MAQIYDSAELSGAGTLLKDNLPVGVNKFLFDTRFNEGTVYFIFETVRNNDGFYDSSSSTNASGLVRIDLPPVGATLVPIDLIQSDYIWGVVLPPGGTVGLTFIPTTQVDAGAVFLRGTGEVTLTIS
tara:strand:- start:433 stop:813 length:381 start_codon:yes stop_codon:yes gene_type:complete